MSIGERIRDRREYLGLTQDQLAKKLGYKSKSSIAKIENDGRDLPQTKIKAIADALDVTPSYIMGWDEKQLVADISDERVKMVVDLFNRLSQEKQDFIISSIKGLLLNQ